MGPTGIIEAVDVSTERSPRLGDAGISPQVHLLVFDGPPEPFHENWTCPYQTGHSAWLGDLLAMNSRGDLMRKPECGWMFL